MSHDEHLITRAGGDGEPVDQIQRRVDKATRGPWDVDAGDATIYSLGYSDGPMFLFAAHEDHKDGFGNAGDDCTDDAEFIAHARTDVPYLLALVREQAAKLEAVEDFIGRLEVASEASGVEAFYAVGKVSARKAAEQLRKALEVAA